MTRSVAVGPKRYRLAPLSPADRGTLTLGRHDPHTIAEALGQIPEPDRERALGRALAAVQSRDATPARDLDPTDDQARALAAGLVRMVRASLAAANPGLGSRALDRIIAGLDYDTFMQAVHDVGHLTMLRTDDEIHWNGCFQLFLDGYIAAFRRERMSLSEGEPCSN